MRDGPVVIVNVESTCWEGPRPTASEIIEISAVRCIDPAVVFHAFVRPILSPKLSTFCRSLTGISQREVDQAPTFPAVFERFLRWSKPPVFPIVTWGSSAPNRLKRDVVLHQLDPFSWGPVDLEATFAKIYGIKPCGVAKALRMLGLAREGPSCAVESIGYRGMDTARDVRRIWLELALREQRQGDRR